MSTLYLIRHGQTLFNRLHRKQGWCDSPLTELGIEQAETTRRWLVERGLRFDHAYASTSERACDTLELLVPGMAYERVKDLREWNFGTFEGLTEDTNPPLPYGDFYKPFGGEGEMEFRARLTGALTEIMSRPGHERVLCVSHGAACAQVLRACDFEIRGTGAHLGNCCVLAFDFDGARFTVEDIENPND